jgi:hypothetical protein
VVVVKTPAEAMVMKEPFVPPSSLVGIVAADYSLSYMLLRTALYKYLKHRNLGIDTTCPGCFLDYAIVWVKIESFIKYNE